MKKFKVEGTIYYEAIIEIADEKETLECYNDCIDSSADLNKIAKRIALETVVFEESFIEGIGDKDKNFKKESGSWWQDDAEIEEIK